MVVVVVVVVVVVLLVLCIFVLSIPCGIDILVYICPEA